MIPIFQQLPQDKAEKLRESMQTNLQRLYEWREINAKKINEVILYANV